MDLERALATALPALRRSTSPVDGITYARDLWPRHHLAVSEGRIAEHRPGAVVWPRDTEEVAAVVRFCAGEGIPIAPFGAGSGVCGGILPNQRVVVVDLKPLTRWRALDREKLTLEVESGVLGIRLEEELAAKGLTLGHFPSSILCSTVGGWVAARSAGQCSGRYGKIEDMVASLECVVGKGDVVRMHRRVHGPDLTPLMIGSEGVLGIVTSSTLRLHPAPEAQAFGAFSFRSLEAGWTAMREMFQHGLRPAVSRLYDPFDSFMAKRGAVRKPRAKKKSELVPGAGAFALRSILRAPRVLNELVDLAGERVFDGSTLVLIFEGRAGEVEQDLARAAAIARGLGASDLGEAPARHWLAHRYGVSYRQAPVFMAGAFSDTMEVAATWSRLGALYHGVRAALGKHVFVMAHLSHAYPDGCSIYFTFAGSAKTPAEAEAKYDAAWRDALDAAIGAGATLSHHHGVGRSKAPKLGGELGAGVDVIRALRNEFDPAGIFNPDNLLPRGVPERRKLAEPPAVPVVDRDSMLVHASGKATLGEVETSLARFGLSLGVAPEHADATRALTVDRWIAEGAVGAPDPWADPADHLVAGFRAVLTSGVELEIRPAPRRATGPDLFALFLGARGAAGTLTSVHLRAHASDRARVLEASLDRDPPAGDAESRLFERAARAAGSVR